MIAYRDKDNPGTVAVFEEANPDLDARPNFERVELETVPESAINAAKRARASREAIEASASIRAMRTEVEGEAAAAAMKAAAVSTETAGTLLANAAHYLPEPVTPSDGVLSRPGVDDVQIGDNPDEHPRTREELLAQAEYDAAHPRNAGVLKATAETRAAGDDKAKTRKATASKTTTDKG